MAFGDGKGPIGNTFNKDRRDKLNKTLEQLRQRTEGIRGKVQQGLEAAKKGTEALKGAAEPYIPQGVKGTGKELIEKARTLRDEAVERLRGLVGEAGELAPHITARLLYNGNAQTIAMFPADEGNYRLVTMDNIYVIDSQGSIIQTIGCSGIVCAGHDNLDCTAIGIEAEGGQGQIGLFRGNLPLDTHNVSSPPLRIVSAGEPHTFVFRLKNGEVIGYDGETLHELAYGKRLPQTTCQNGDTICISAAYMNRFYSHNQMLAHILITCSDNLEFVLGIPLENSPHAVSFQDSTLFVADMTDGSIQKEYDMSAGIAWINVLQDNTVLVGTKDGKVHIITILKEA